LKSIDEANRVSCFVLDCIFNAGSVLPYASVDFLRWRVCAAHAVTAVELLPDGDDAEASCTQSWHEASV
jgi:hypothetical protein